MLLKWATAVKKNIPANPHLVAAAQFLRDAVRHCPASRARTVMTKSTIRGAIGISFCVPGRRVRSCGGSEISTAICPLLSRACQPPITPFYKRGCQEKHFPYDWKRSRHPAPVCNEAL